MPVRRVRRIFRPQAALPGGRRSHRHGVLRSAGRTALVVALLGAGGVALRLVLDGLPAGRVPAPHGVLTAAAPDVAVVDGDTLRLNRTVLHLHGVAAPPRGQACRRDRGPAYDCGAAASQALAGIVRGRTVACRLAGRDPAGFDQGDCRAGDTDVNRAIIAAGWARAADATSDLDPVEAAARAARRGAWSDPRGASF